MVLSLNLPSWGEGKMIQSQYLNQSVTYEISVELNSFKNPSELVRYGARSTPQKA